MTKSGGCAASAAPGPYARQDVSMDDLSKAFRHMLAADQAQEQLLIDAAQCALELLHFRTEGATHHDNRMCE